MIQTLFFLTAIFSSWYGYPGDYNTYTTYESDHIEFDCKHNKVLGCVLWINNEMAIIITDINQIDPKGCSVQTHEFFHIMGYEEWEIPDCIKSQEFRK